MKNLLAAAIVMMYVVSSGGILLIEYSCDETGLSGVTVASARTCYAPPCGEGDAGEPDECCDGTCCEVDVRDQASDVQIVPPQAEFGMIAVVSQVAPVVTTAAPVRLVALTPPLPAPTGFDRPIRI